MKTSEISIQATYFQYMFNHHKETRDCIYHIANEGKRTVREWSSLKASGFRKGIQDMHFIWAGKLYIIEFKTTNGDLSPHQKAVHAAHGNQGVMTYVFRDSSEAIIFSKAIIHGNCLDNFAIFISPYALQGSNYEQLAIEAAQGDKKRKMNKCTTCISKSCTGLKNTK